MARNNQKKALLRQSLFFSLWFASLCFAQGPRLESPKPGEPLDAVQTFIVSIGQVEPTRLYFYINDRLIQARTQAPWEFTTAWDTNLDNTVKLEARYEDGTSSSNTYIFKAVRADVVAEVTGLQCFPFAEKALGDQVPRIQSGDDRFIEPQTFVRASEKHPLELAVILDVSGSMKEELSGITAELKETLKEVEADGGSWTFFTFDRFPRTIDNDTIMELEDFVELYRGRAYSVIWDAVATAADLFQGSPRRVILLISDGRDDGGRHDAQTALDFLQAAGAALIWIDPADLGSSKVADIAETSGGFKLDASERGWRRLRTRLYAQYYLLAPDGQWPIKLDAGSTKLWYPRRER